MSEKAEETEDLIKSVTLPSRMDYVITPGKASTRFLLGMGQGRILGQRCPNCSKVYVPPRGSCTVCAVPTVEEVELPGTGTVTSFCVVNLQFYGQAMECPYVCACILLDDSDLPFFGLISEIPYEDVQPGLRVEAVWVDKKDLGPTFESIKYFRPTGEPDAPFESYKEHL